MTRHWAVPLLARLIAFSMLFAMAASATVAAQTASREEIACHDEATQKYLAGFRKVGLHHETFNRFPLIVTTFQNDRTRYDRYYAECLDRLNPANAQSP